ncbi:MAG TPA: transaldolase family protein [Syntrophorhabdaceae bacterium]|nr:transaldolase family protein [Syntrophorhabdaceae bacterium]
MRPKGLKTRIFLDGGNPSETMQIIDLLGFVDGQTTNPTLISRNPEARKRLETGHKFSAGEILDFYKDVVKTISSMIPEGSISVEVYAEPLSNATDMVHQGMEMFSWIPNAHIKFPTSHEGLKAANTAIAQGLRINMTLCFSQAQAAAVYAATRGARKGQVFVSPFIGRLDDRGEDGMDVIANIMKMYEQGDGHVEVLTASVRNLDHFLYALKLGSDIITAPFEILKAWGKEGLKLPGPNYRYNRKELKAIPYKEIDLSLNWQEYDIVHDLTQAGMERFSADWNALIG